MRPNTYSTSSKENFWDLAQPWLVCLSAGLFFLYDFLQMTLFNTINSHLSHTFSLTPIETGQLAGIYMNATVLFLLSCGILLDRISTRKVILTAMVVCIAATFCFAHAQTLFAAKLCRFIAGATAAYCFLSCVMIASRWFPTHRLGLAIGCIVTMAMVGGSLAQTPMAILVDHIGWRQAITITGWIGIVFLVIMYVMIHDSPTQKTLKPKPKEHIQSAWSLLHQAAKNPQNWLCGGYTSLLNVFVFVAGAVWGQTYLTHVHGLNHINAAYVSTMIFIGTVLGSPLMSFISDTIKQRRLPMILGAASSFLLALVIVCSHSLSTSSLALLFFAIGFTSSTQVLTYPTIVESNPSNIRGTSESLSAVLIMGVGALYQPLFGWLVSVTPNAAYSEGFAFAFWLIPAAFALGLILSLFVKETNCKPYEPI
jgi:sugar phosphate permease